MKNDKFVQFIFKAISLACSVAAFVLLIMDKGDLEGIMKIMAFALICNGLASINVKEEKE